MKIDGNTPVNVLLNLEQVNTIVTSLGVQPYDRVASVINAIQVQVSQQVNAMQTANKVADELKEDKPAA